MFTKKWIKDILVFGVLATVIMLSFGVTTESFTKGYKATQIIIFGGQR